MNTNLTNLKFEATQNIYLKHDFYKLMNFSLFPDVTLICDDKRQLHAHRFVLASCSDTFKNLLNNDEGNCNSFIYLVGIQFEEMESMLELLYLGETSIQKSRLKEMYNVAENLDFQKISLLLQSVNDNTTILGNYEETSNTNEFVEETYSSYETDAFEDFETLNEILEEKFEEENKIDEKFVKKIQDLNNVEKELNESIEHNLDGNMCCNLCSYKTKDKSNIKKHVLAIHFGKTYSCKFCNIKSKDQSGLKKHVEAKHEGVKYACDKCAYETSHNQQLKFHIASKHNGFTIACGQCSFKTMYKHLLQQHIDSKHLGITYSCEKCDYQCSSLLEDVTGI